MAPVKAAAKVPVHERLLHATGLKVAAGLKVATSLRGRADIAAEYLKAHAAVVDEIRSTEVELAREYQDLCPAPCRRERVPTCLEVHRRPRPLPPTPATLA